MSPDEKVRVRGSPRPVRARSRMSTPRCWPRAPSRRARRAYPASSSLAANPWCPRILGDLPRDARPRRAPTRASAGAAAWRPGSATMTTSPKTPRASCTPGPRSLRLISASSPPLPARRPEALATRWAAA